MGLSISLHRHCKVMPNHTFQELAAMVMCCEVPALEKALNEGFDVNMLEDGYDGLTLLMVAAAGCGKVEALQLLLDRKACLDIKDDDGFTALDIAQDEGNTECAERLIAAALERDLIRVAQTKPVKASAWV